MKPLLSRVVCLLPLALGVCFALNRVFGTSQQSKPRVSLDSISLGQNHSWSQDQTRPASPQASTPVTSINFQLTFDDGPHPVHTPAILDWLKARRLKATFYILGERAAKYPKLVKRIFEEGHQIGNHTWAHPLLTKLSDRQVRDEIRRTHDLIQKLTGTAPTAFRPPYGALTPRQQVWIRKEFGYTIVFWDIDTLDWKKSSTREIAARIRAGHTPGGRNIILAHDIHPRILPALQSLQDAITALPAPAIVAVK